ncbi:F-box/kelch-repeat protein, partial [Cucurbita argyrosperma subsp. sororia]
METFHLIPGLPDELGLDCITRLPYTTHRLASAVCRRWRQLISSSHFYYHRRKLRRHPSSLLLRSDSSPSLFHHRMEALHLPRLRTHPFRPTHSILGPNPSNSPLPRWPPFVLPHSQHGRQIGAHGRLGPRDLRSHC